MIITIYMCLCTTKDVSSDSQPENLQLVCNGGKPNGPLLHDRDCKYQSCRVHTHIYQLKDDIKEKPITTTSNLCIKITKYTPSSLLWSLLVIETNTTKRDDSNG